MSRMLGVGLSWVLFPFRWILRIIAGATKLLLSPLLRTADASPRLSRLISTLSSSMATQRGLLLLIGTVLVLLSLVVHAAVLAGLVMFGDGGRYLYWLCIPFAILHMGVLVGFTGIMLAVPLGQGYSSQRE